MWNVQVDFSGVIVVAVLQESQGGVKNVRFSHMNLVDLAGSERQKDTNTVGARLKVSSTFSSQLSKSRCLG